MVNIPPFGTSGVETREHDTCFLGNFFFWSRIQGQNQVLWCQNPRKPKKFRYTPYGMSTVDHGTRFLCVMSRWRRKWSQSLLFLRWYLKKLKRKFWCRIRTFRIFSGISGVFSILFSNSCSAEKNTQKTCKVSYRKRTFSFLTCFFQAPLDFWHLTPSCHRDSCSTEKSTQQTCNLTLSTRTFSSAPEFLFWNHQNSKICKKSPKKDRMLS